MTKTEFINSLSKAAEEAAKYFKKEKLISDSDLLPKSKDLSSRDYKLGLITDFDADEVDFFEEEKVTLALYKSGRAYDHILYGCFYADRESLGKPKFTKLITNYLVYILHKDLDKYKNIRTVCISVDANGEGLEDLEIHLDIAAKLSKYIKVSRKLQSLQNHESLRFVLLDDIFGDGVHHLHNIMLDSVVLQFDTTKKKTTKNDRSGVSKKVKKPK